VITGEHEHWFLKNNLKDELLSIEQAMDAYIHENISVLCPYDVSDMLDEHLLKTIINSHTYVIIDDLPQIYKKTN
jgi:hypothetical protein